MATVILPPSIRTPTLADVITDAIPAGRVLLQPLPGTATVDDVETIRLRERRLCELVDGILVEKVMGQYESILACVLIRLLGNFVGLGNLGFVSGEGGMIQLAPQLVRIPDVAFDSRNRLPSGVRPKEAIPLWVPDLAVEILNVGNTRGEMEQKLRDYFAAGVTLVWYLDPRERAVWVYEAVDKVTRLDETETLDGGAVLPGFSLKISDWLDAAD